ncbi:hypothetical protein OPS25_14240 [Alteromonas ponticola]|uniref:Uncharacterized protein n=1 Tax=Alteromonas aquimaris TaxID=2998417 RepID=A0ABT3PC16_9ALTE|nr:hypothetical protein [Alteromonas aquimaris]MCW8109666.1 hypothetical protein [Alteromonas aquimaris]
MFTSHQSTKIEDDAKGADKMVEMAMQQPGFLSVESSRKDVGMAV